MACKRGSCGLVLDTLGFVKNDSVEMSSEGEQGADFCHLVVIHRLFFSKLLERVFFVSLELCTDCTISCQDNIVSANGVPCLLFATGKESCLALRGSCKYED